MEAIQAIRRAVACALDAFLDRDLPELVPTPVLGVAAGHGATYLVRDASRHPGRYSRLVLVAPTWRGPLPTMTQGRRPGLCGTVRRTLERPVVGRALFELNISRPVIGWMMREHVYADPAGVTPALIGEKRAVARRAGGRSATAAFVSGGLDPVATRADFLSLFGEALPPTLVIRPRKAPARSAAEMDALAATGRVTTVEVNGALAPHEEDPDAVASAILSFA